MQSDNAGGWPDADKPGVPLNPERIGAHEIKTGAGDTWTVLWVPRQHRVGPHYITPSGGTVWEVDAAKWWTYLGPCLTPSEIAAREAAAAMAMRDAAVEVCNDERDRANHMREGLRADKSRDLGAIAHACGAESAAKLAAQRIRALPLPASAQAALDAVVREAVMREREACAALVMSLGPDQCLCSSLQPNCTPCTVLVKAAAAIRARGTGGGDA